MWRLFTECKRISNCLCYRGQSKSIYEIKLEELIKKMGLTVDVESLIEHEMRIHSGIPHYEAARLALNKFRANHHYVDPWPNSKRC